MNKPHAEMAGRLVKQISSGFVCFLREINKAVMSCTYHASKQFNVNGALFPRGQYETADARGRSLACGDISFR
jgi:hypothetical protein